MPDEAAQQRRQRRGRLGNRAVAADPGRRLDHRVVVEERQRAVVAQVDHLDVLAVAEQRRQQRDRGLRVERAAPVRQQLRFVVERRVGVHPQQLPLQAGHLRRPCRPLPLLAGRGIVRVEVAQVVRGHGAKLGQQGQGQPDAPGYLLPVTGEQVRQPVLPVDEHRARPGQVVQAGVVK